MELTDLQINKRIAEIEDARTYQIGLHIYIGKDEYNPLTDDALLKQLIFKYKVSIDFNQEYVSITDNGLFVINYGVMGIDVERAVLLCIIEAKAND